ncbi:hypothetical protein Q1695_012490 [Nippostrongylus brasiliensis]|nr:hypothetical protein Q1695_012490 [Nippostrongylus brasiliensis]
MRCVLLLLIVLLLADATAAKKKDCGDVHDECDAVCMRDTSDHKRVNDCLWKCQDVAFKCLYGPNAKRY